MAMATEEQVVALKALYDEWVAPEPRYVQQVDMGGYKADALGHANTTAALLKSDMTFGWEPMAFDENGLPRFTMGPDGLPIGLWIRLTVHDVTRPGFGSVKPSQAKTKYANGSLEKELIGDAIRNAAMRFGVALDLWSKSDLSEQSAVERSNHPSAVSDSEPSPVTNVTPLKGRLAAKAGKPNLASRPDHDEVIRLVNELAEGPKATFREWYEAQVNVNGFPKGGLTGRVLSDEQLASCKEMALQAQRPLTTQEIQEAFDATPESEEPFD